MVGLLDNSIVKIIEKCNSRFMDSEELLARYAAGERDFAGAKLREINLEDTELREINLLTSAILKSSELYETNFLGANFSHANLRFARHFHSGDTYGIRFQNTICPDGTLGIAPDVRE